MEEKKAIKISLSTVFLIIAIIIILIMGMYMYFQEIKYKNEILEQEKNANNLQTEVDSLQDKISNTINSEKDSNSIVTEKQTLSGLGYTITLYSNNEVKIYPVSEDLKTIFGKTIINKNAESINVTGISGDIEKMYQGNNGAGVDPITFFILKDGTVQYITPISQIVKNNDTIPTTFKIDGKIEGISNVIDLKANSDDTISAITKDGKKIICWNEWMESANGTYKKSKNINIDDSQMPEYIILNNNTFYLTNTLSSLEKPQGTYEEGPDETIEFNYSSQDYAFLNAAKAKFEKINKKLNIILENGSEAIYFEKVY